MLFPTKSVDVVILSCEYVLERGRKNPGNDNASLEDQLVKEALERRGLRTEIKSWSDKSVVWENVGAILVRSCWDYVFVFPDFLPWLKQTAILTPFINSPELLFWNIDKNYLKELAGKGVKIVPSIFIEKGEKRSLTHILGSTPWKEVVLKPCVSGGARHTYRFQVAEGGAFEEIFQELIQEEHMILQPFIPEIISRGEYSFMFFDGEYSFTTLKQAKQGDYRVQDDFGGTVVMYQPTEEEIQFAKAAVAACPYLPAYARVDCIPTDEGLLLSEIELIEPELWFRFLPAAAESMADAVLKRLAP